MLKSATGLERVPCPLDPSHTVYKRNLEAHMKICGVTSTQSAQEAEGVFCLNCNSGVPATIPSAGSDVVDASALANKVHSVFEQHVAPHVQLYISGVYNAPPCDPADASLYGEVHKDIIGAQSASEKTRHADQDTAILAVMAREGLISREGVRDVRDNIYVEFGAGKGFLGYSVQLYYHMLMKQLSVKNSSICSASDAADVVDAASVRPKLLLVERSGCRRKADNKQSATNNKYDEGYSNNCYRYRLDIRHAFLPTILNQMLVKDKAAVPSHEAPKKVIVVAKHLCGVATDMSVRSLEKLQKHNIENTDAVNAAPYGVAIATCCHHICNWDDYIGREWMEGHGFTGPEFALLKTWSCWGTMPVEAQRGSREAPTVSGSSANADGEDESEHKAAPPVSARPAGITREQMRTLGREIKCLIDFGRAWYMKEVLKFSDVKYTQYCASTVTPECRVLLGKR
mgnify:CR=1 FL=1